MTIKEYLSQARYLDMRIDSKIKQLHSLNDLASKCTSVITGMPHSPNKGTSTMADTINKIIDLECEINSDIDKLVSLKKEIAEVINRVQKTEYRMILEKRYLALQNWERIASDMGYELRWLYRLHGKALHEAEKIMKNERSH